MPQPASALPGVVRFAAFELDRSAGELRKKGLKLRIEGQPLQVLELLLERPGQVVTREELQQRLWPSDTFVDFEQGINSAIKRLRQALDDSTQTPRFIETLPRRGYRFIYPLSTPSDPSDRPPSEPRSRVASRRFLIGAVCLAAAVGGLVATGVWQFAGTGVDRRPVIRLAVLPLENLSGDAGDSAVLDELHDELIARLNEVGAFAVIARDSAVRYQERMASLPDVATVLNVDAVLICEVHRKGQGWHLTAYLTPPQRSERLWTKGYEANGRDLALVPSWVARGLADHFRVVLTAREEVRLAKAKPLDPSLFRAYATGQQHLHKWTPDALRKALVSFEEAIAIDATYAPAWAARGEAFLVLGETGAGQGDEESIRRAEAALVRAIELDPTLREAHESLGRLRFRAWDWSRGAREYELANEADPHHPGFPVYLLALGRFGEAVEAQRRAARLDPLNYSSQLIVGWTAFMAGQFDEAIRALKATIDLDPRESHGHRELAWAYAATGRHSDAIRECETASALMIKEGSNAAVPGGCEWVYARAGRRAEALEMARRIEQAPGGTSHRFMRLAHTFDALGERERALSYLQQAYDARAASLPQAWYVPMLSNAIKADPRFQDLIRRTGQPWAKFPPVRVTSLINMPGHGPRP